MADRISSDPAIDGDWASYYEKTGQRPPRQTLIRALDAFDREGRPEGALAADLGCGSGRDTKRKEG
jgi:tellurite methyltransferase